MVEISSLQEGDRRTTWEHDASGHWLGTALRHKIRNMAVALLHYLLHDSLYLLFLLPLSLPHSSLGSSEASPQSSSPSHFQRAGMQRPESLQRNSSTPHVIWAATETSSLIRRVKSRLDQTVVAAAQEIRWAVHEQEVGSIPGSFSLHAGLSSG